MPTDAGRRDRAARLPGGLTGEAFCRWVISLTSAELAAAIRVLSEELQVRTEDAVREGRGASG